MRSYAVLGLTALAAVLTARGAAADPGAADPGTGEHAREAADLFRVAACGGDAATALPARLDDRPLREATTRRALHRHCDRMQRVYAHQRRWWVAKAQALLSTLRPADAPSTVVYPFGGGDLSAALAVFPDATEITTLSLEPAGDVRAIDAIAPERLVADTTQVAAGIRRLYSAAHSTTEVLQDAAHAQLPGTLVFALAGLALHDMVPTQLRYFTLERDGSVRYLTSGVSGSVEIQFRPRQDTRAAVRTYRHIHADLGDDKLDERVLAHLRGKGTVAAMTKAASFLLWRDDFGKLRDYLLGHVAWMVSDASGIPPRDAAAAGFEQITYGQFTAPYFTRDPRGVRRDLVKLWSRQPQRPLAFRFGYPDRAGNNHLMVMRRAAK